MGSVNLDFKHGIEKYKGKIIGFDRHGFAVYEDNGYGFQAIETCKCCGQQIYSQLSGADFCPLCAVALGLVDESFASEIALPSWQGAFKNFADDNDFRRFIFEKAEGFKAGIRFALNYSKPSIKGEVGFDIWS
jgi:hypothetical protein